MHQTMQESQQSGSGANEIDLMLFNKVRNIDRKETSNRVKYNDTEIERDED